MLTPREAQTLWPLMQIDDVVGAAFLPTDGQASPSDIVQALARGARGGGVTIREDVGVTGIRLEGGRVVAVETGQGVIACEKAVICAGQWSRAIGALAGVNVPLVSVQHQYLITERIDGVTPDLPTLRDPDRLTYYKEEVGGLVMGGYEPNPKPWAEQGIPEGFHFTLLDGDLDHFEPMMALALGRVPALETAGIKQFINGPESFTPDGNFILGEAPEVRGVFVGAGFNAFGIASGGGAGMALAEWVATGAPPYDLWPVDIRRFGRNHVSTDWVRTRTLEAYGKHYAMAWPHEEYLSGRPVRRSPLYNRLRDKGACFGEKLGWERPNWFAGPGESTRGQTHLRTSELVRGGRTRASGLPRGGGAVRPDVVREIHACRSRRGGGARLDRGERCRPPAGKPRLLAVAQRARGDRVRSDHRAAGGGRLLHRHRHRLCDPRFRLDPTLHPGRPRRAADGCDIAIRRAVADGSAGARHPRDGVRERRVRRRAFRFGTVRRLAVAGAPAMALRITYVGELGWELHVPVEFALTVYDALMAAGEPHGLRDAGYRAIESLRLEKGYRAWGSDIGPDHSPLMAGLGFAVKLRKNIPFQGREALETQRAGRLPRLLAGFTVVDPEVVLLGRETIYRDGRRVGWLSSAGWGYTVGMNIGYGYVRDRENGVDAEMVLSGRYELEVATERVPAEVFIEPLYDPGMNRIKA